MEEDKPQLRLVGPDFRSNDDEFAPLPYYPWDQRPETLPVDQDEAATAIHLADGDEFVAAHLLKIPIVKLRRLLRNSPRLQRIQDEALGVSHALAAHVPLQTLHDPNADARRLEWAAKFVLSSRSAQGHPLSPAPAANIQSNVNVDRRTVVLWGNGEKIAEIGPAESSPTGQEDV